MDGGGDGYFDFDGSYCDSNDRVVVSEDRGVNTDFKLLQRKALSNSNVCVSNDSRSFW